MARDRSGLERLWQRDLSMAAAPLMVVGAMYRGVIALRNAWWRRMARRADVPVISVGNLTVGGNSKTPFTLYLASRLQNRGCNVAIVSRGYGGKRQTGNATLVADRGELVLAPDEAGDEPAMMARRFSGPIAVARRRINAIEMLAARAPLDAVILDDGFQHVRLRRDVDLVLVSNERGFGNCRMLPAGPMREPLSALKRADAIVIVSSSAGASSGIRPSEMERLKRSLVLHARVRPRSLVTSAQGGWHESPPMLAGRRVLAVSGLADPSSFHAMVREIEADLVGVLEYPDHHSYTSGDWHTIASAAREVDVIVTTEKDLVKLERFPFARDSLYALRLEVLMPDDEARMLDELIFSRLQPEKITGGAAQEVSRNAR